MIKIMVVDDDFLVRSNIKLLLADIVQTEETYHYELIAEAADGAEANDILDVLVPDIIISDIRMPKVDGIELQRDLKKKYPSVQMIMLSNYDDYEYVREALKNGAVDYILKHKLTSEVLRTSLERACELMSKKIGIDLTKGSSLAALKRDFLLSLIAGFYKQLEEIQSRITVLGLPLATKNLLNIIMTVQRNNSITQEAYQLEYSITNIIDEILQDTHSGICCHVADEKYIILLSYASIYSEKVRQERYFEVLSRISVCMQKYLNIEVNFYPGNLAPSILEVKKSYQAAELKYRNRYYEGIDNRKQNSDRPFDILAVFDAGKERRLMADIRSNNNDATIQIIQEVFEELRKWSPTLAESQIVFIDLLGVLNRTCKEKHIDITMIYADTMTPQEKFNEFTSISMAQEWFTDLFDRVLKGEEEQLGLPSSDYVASAVSFIHRHYAENISQTMVANEIGISPAYLSKLFKDNLNIGFMEYLNNYRLEKAKKLLEQQNLSNKTIAQLCGFHEDAYFSKVFKKCIKMTPKEYRKQLAK